MVFVIIFVPITDKMRINLFMQETQETQVQPLGWKDREEGTATHSSILAWEIHRQRRLGGYSPWGHRVLDMTERRNKSKWTLWWLREKRGGLESEACSALPPASPCPPGGFPAGTALLPLPSQVCLRTRWICLVCLRQCTGFVHLFRFPP